MCPSEPWQTYLLSLSKQIVCQIEEMAPGAEWLKDRMSHCITKNFYPLDQPSEEESILLVEELPQGERSRLLHDLPTIKDREDFLQLLAYHFPSEAHFRAHYGRFLYDNAPREEKEEEKVFQKSRDELEKALSIATHDATIVHMRGMCPRRLMKRLLYRYGLSQGSSSYPKVLQLGEEARDYFKRARNLNPADEHSYVSEIEMLRDLVSHGTRRSHDKIRLLAERGDLRDWLDSAFQILRQAEERLLIRRSSHFRRIRGDLESLQGNYKDAISSYRTALDRLHGKVGTIEIRYQIASLHYRYAISLLLRNEQDAAMPQLYQARQELELVLRERDDERALDLWFRVYTLLPEYSPETAAEYLERLYRQTEGGLEAAFGLMCIWFIHAAQGAPLGYRRLSEFRSRSAELARRIPSLSYAKFWLGKDWRLIPDRLVPRVDSEREERNVSELMRLSGYIYEYQRPTIGRIRVGEGEVDLMFQPGRRPPGELPFTQADAENRTRVTCVVSFTYEHPRAYDVKRLHEDKESST